MQCGIHVNRLLCVRRHRSHGTAHWLCQTHVEDDGQTLPALVTFGTWCQAKTTLAQLAAKVTPLDQDVAVSPEAIHQRMNKKALAFLQDMIRQVLAKVQGLDHLCEDELFTYFTKVYLADSTGFGLPDSLKDTLPGFWRECRKSWSQNSSCMGL